MAVEVEGIDGTPEVPERMGRAQKTVTGPDDVARGRANDEPGRDTGLPLGDVDGGG